MTHDEIISIYKEVSNKICNGTEWCWSGAGEPLKLFAQLVAAKEREACAKVADEYSAIGEYLATLRIEEFDRGWLGCAKKVANAIRARKEQT